jgi:hypothetical protein
MKLKYLLFVFNIKEINLRRVKMHRKAISILLAFIFLFSGCTSLKKASDNNQSRGITTNKVMFTTISDLNTLPSSLGQKIEKLKEQRGYYYAKVRDEYFLAVFSGTKNTGGYTIKVTLAEDIEGITKVTVEEKSPEKDAIVTQALTYPLTVIKLPLIHERVIVADVKGNMFNKLN